MAIDANHPSPGTIIARPTPQPNHKGPDVSSHRLPWEKYNHCDVWLYPGTQIIAPDAGVISPDNRSYGRQNPTGATRGLHLYLVSHSSPFVYYFGGLRALGAKKGEHVSAGDVIGFSGVLGGTPHLHFSLPPGFNPQDFVRQAYRLAAPKGGRKNQPAGGGGAATAAAPPAGWATDATSGDNAALPDQIEDAWHTLEFALRVTLPTSAEAVKQAAHDVHKAVY